MKLRLLVVGRGARELAAYETRLLGRLRTYAEVEVIELPEGRARRMEQRRQEEAKAVLRTARGGFILFDERGEGLASKQWADRLRALPAGAGLDFVIGGAGGVDEQIRQAAGHCWSLSRLTLPHQLARVLVIEQLYRAFTMLAGHPYHRA